eukprot:TRINITY_DN3250_c0_g1_i1.p1 TRINITY_DN3250_c0_g1~~TRINITY_DN3250_c0_g1_i1.p1  ORF type:complete len:274 (+),score=46.96 TRINITY_DN3250_c0_g1_i1:383-1204(+)
MHTCTSDYIRLCALQHFALYYYPMIVSDFFCSFANGRAIVLSWCNEGRRHVQEDLAANTAPHQISMQLDTMDQLLDVAKGLLSPAMKLAKQEAREDRVRVKETQLCAASMEKEVLRTRIQLGLASKSAYADLKSLTKRESKLVAQLQELHCSPSSSPPLLGAPCDSSPLSSPSSPSSLSRSISSRVTGSSPLRHATPSRDPRDPSPSPSTEFRSECGVSEFILEPPILAGRLSTASPSLSLLSPSSSSSSPSAAQYSLRWFTPGLLDLALPFL